ncbi:KEG [Symbiodinium sp. CCMP2592]|nr:KEG [Symbiodinium sp. CCMP2592]
MAVPCKTFHFSWGSDRRSLKIYSGTPVEDIIHAVRCEYNLPAEDCLHFQDAGGVRTVLSHACPDGMGFVVRSGTGTAFPRPATATAPPRPAEPQTANADGRNLQLTPNPAPRGHPPHEGQLDAGHTIIKRDFFLYKNHTCVDGDLEPDVHALMFSFKKFWKAALEEQMAMKGQLLKELCGQIGFCHGDWLLHDFESGAVWLAVRESDALAPSCKAFGFKFGDAVQDKKGKEYTVLGVGPPAAGRHWHRSNRIRLCAHEFGSSEAQTLRVDCDVDFVRRGPEPVEFGTLGACIAFLQPSTSDVQAMLGWDGAALSDEGIPTAGINRLLGLLGSSGWHVLEKHFGSIDTNTEDGMRRCEHMGIKKGDRIRGLAAGWPFDRLGVVTTVNAGVFQILSESSQQDVFTWHAKFEEMRKDPEADLVRPGALVKLRQAVQQPRYGWGGLTHELVLGVVQKVEKCIVSVNLGFGSRWHGSLDEFEAIKPSDSLQVGSHVRFKSPGKVPRYGWGGHKMRAAIGVVAKIEDEDIKVNCPDMDEWKCKCDEIEVDPVANRIRPGEPVQVRPQVSVPKFDWGGVNHSSVGVVESITHDGIVVVDFPCCCCWHGLLGELEIAQTRQRVALIIGNHTYIDKEAYPFLKGAKNDVEDIKNKLMSLEFDFVLKVENICRRDLEVFLRQLKDNVVNGSIVVIYFAGHGEEDHQTVLLVAPDSTKIDTDFIFNAITGWSSKDLFVLFILDCCRLKSDDSSSSSSSRFTIRAPPEKEMACNQLYCVFSCQKFKSAYEKRHGDFGKCFLELVGEDLSVHELFDRVADRLRKPNRQQPEILSRSHEGSRIRLSSDKNIYRASSLHAQAGSSDGSDESDDCMDELERLKELVQNVKTGDERARRDMVTMVDYLHDVREILRPRLTSALLGAALEGHDPALYEEDLKPREVRRFRFVFDIVDDESAHASSSRQPRGVVQPCGDLRSMPDCVSRLANLLWTRSFGRPEHEKVELILRDMDIDDKLSSRFAQAKPPTALPIIGCCPTSTWTRLQK